MSSKLELYLSGGRFDAAEGFPLDSLPALRAVGSLVESVARDLFFSENPERKRVPAGFKSSFSPALTRLVGGGSAVCDIAGWERVQPGLANYFDDAQSEAFSLFQSLQADQVTFPAWCSRRTKKQLAAVLGAVTNQETIRLSVEANGVAPDPVTLGATQRDKAKAAAQAVVAGQEEDFSIAGRIYAIENDPWAIGIKVREGGQRLRIAIAEHLRDRARDEFDADGTHLVLVQGKAERDDESGGMTFVLAQEIRKIDGPIIVERLEKLAGLSNGWVDDNEDSRPPSKALCRWVERQLWQAIEAQAWNRPHLFATVAGGIDAVWRFEQHTLRACFTSRPLEVRLRAINLTAKTATVSDSSRSLSPLIVWANDVLEGAL